MLSSFVAMVDTPTEKELVIQLYDTYRQFMYNICMSMLKKREDAEDAVHDAFVRIISNIDKIGNPYSRKTKSYITVITKNICIDHLRKSNAMPDDYDTENVYPDEPSDMTDTRITYERIMRNIKRLAPSLKNVAFLYFVQQLKANDIAEILDIEKNTVYVYVSRIRKLLLDKKE